MKDKEKKAPEKAPGQQAPPKKKQEQQEQQQASSKKSKKKNKAGAAKPADSNPQVPAEPILTDVIGVPLQMELSKMLKTTTAVVESKLGELMREEDLCALWLTIRLTELATAALGFVSPDQKHLLAFARLVRLDCESAVIVDVVGPKDLRRRLWHRLKEDAGDAEILSLA